MLLRFFLLVQRLALLAVLSVSLTASAYGHRAPDSGDAALAFVTANGGELCGDGPEGHPPGVQCLACQIVTALDLPPPAALPQRLVPVALVLPAPRQDPRAMARVRDPGHSPQGPPAA